MQSESGEGRQEDVGTVDAGEPTSSTGGDQARAREEDRPDLDERQRRIAEERKPMGPPLADDDTAADERADTGPTEGPTDPD